MMKSEKGYAIVDVRTADEFASGYIKGAINIPNKTIGKGYLLIYSDIISFLIGFSKILKTL